MADWPEDWLTGSQSRDCPACSAPAGRPLMLGMPDGEVFAALDRGEIDIAIGGCIVGETNPTHQCAECGHQF
jgi:hypothetical protein